MWVHGFHGSSKGVNINTDKFLFEIGILLSAEEMFSHLKWNHFDYGSCINDNSLEKKL